jgi:ribosomal protein S18 acetylase RimI-like enzyme
LPDRRPPAVGEGTDAAGVPSAASRPGAAWSIRSATAGDLHAIVALHVESWRRTYADVMEPGYLRDEVTVDRAARWIDRLASATTVTFLAEDAQGGLLGFISALVDHDPVLGTLIDNLHVAGDWQGLGLGRALLRHLSDCLEERGGSLAVHLNVFQRNSAALAFYRRLGATQVGVTRSQLPAARGAAAFVLHWRDMRDIPR